MKSTKLLSAILLAADLASCTVHAMGGHAGMGGGMGMGNTGMSYPDSAQRKETRTQNRDEKRIQTREGTQANRAQRNQTPDPLRNPRAGSQRWSVSRGAVRATQIAGVFSGGHATGDLLPHPWLRPPCHKHGFSSACRAR